MMRVVLHASRDIMGKAVSMSNPMNQTGHRERERARQGISIQSIYGEGPSDLMILLTSAGFTLSAAHKQTLEQRSQAHSLLARLKLFRRMLLNCRHKSPSGDLFKTKRSPLDGGRVCRPEPQFGRALTLMSTLE